MTRVVVASSAGIDEAAAAIVRMFGGVIATKATAVCLVTAPAVTDHGCLQTPVTLELNDSDPRTVGWHVNAPARGAEQRAACSGEPHRPLVGVRARRQSCDDSGTREAIGRNGRRINGEGKSRVEL